MDTVIEITKAPLPTIGFHGYEATNLTYATSLSDYFRQMDLVSLINGLTPDPTLSVVVAKSFQLPKLQVIIVLQTVNSIRRSLRSFLNPNPKLRTISGTVIKISLGYTLLEERDAIGNLPNLGLIQGKIIKTARTEREVLQFVDVKYAESPSDKHRFKPLRPIEKIACPSVVSMKSLQTLGEISDIDDWLTMTINTPNRSNSEAPADFLEGDSVLVVLQYRIGPFGLLSTKTAEIPENAGVQFIKIFIGNFGGDAAKVTVAGQCNAELASILAFPFQLFSKEIAKEIAEKANCEVRTVRDLNRCLMDMSPMQLLDAFTDHGQDKSELSVGHIGGMHFTIDDTNGLLPEHSYNLMLKTSNSYPVMGGCPKNVGSGIVYGEEHNMQSPFKAGVSLTDEVLYLLPYPEHMKHLKPADENMSNRLVELWTSFVANGYPLGSLRSGCWPPMSTFYCPYIRLDETFSIVGNYC
uniref:Carboxylesterase type B domain-containing protein n=1 Tax=Glossina pallidipes TaxID=7398 RepID=A0A1A9ZS65_GLOPL